MHKFANASVAKAMVNPGFKGWRNRPNFWTGEAPMSHCMGVCILGWGESMAIFAIALRDKCFSQGCLHPMTQGLIRK